MAAEIGSGGRLAGGLRFFLLGMLSLILQTLLLRESMFAFHGGEIGFGVFFAVWLAAIAAGARVGAAVAGRSEGGASAALGPGVDRCRPAGRLSEGSGILLALTCLPFLGLLQLSFFRLHRALIPVAAGGYLPLFAYLLLLLVVAAPAAFLIGLLFPLSLRLQTPRPGNAYALESLGSMAGGALASLYALPRIPAPTLILLSGCLLVSLWLIELRLLQGRRATRAQPIALPRRRGPVLRLTLAALLLSLLALLAVTGFGAELDHRLRMVRWRTLATGTEMVVDQATPYHQVTIAEREGEASLYLDGLYQGALVDPFVDSLAAALILTQHPAPRRILLLAPALYGPARVIAGAQGASVTLLRAEALVDRLIEGLIAPGPPPARERGEEPARDAEFVRLRRRTADPRAGVRVLANSMYDGAPPFDLIAVLHGGPSGGASNRLYTQEFFAACSRLLAPGGVLALSLPGTANVASPEVARLRGAVFAALAQEFSDVRITPGTTHYLFATEIVGRAPSPLSWNPDTLAARRARRWPGSAPRGRRFFAAHLPAERVGALQAQLGAQVAGGIAPNQDLRPHVYYEQIRRWDRFSGSRLAALLEAWHAHPWRWTLAFLALLGVGALLLHRRRGPALVSLATTGMAGMGADLMILLLYQTYRGTLYLEVGLIIALFMLGLALGAYLAGRVRRYGCRWGAIALSDLLWVVFLLGLIPLCNRFPDAPAEAGLLLSIAAVVAGALTALPFPWVVARISESQAASHPCATQSPGAAQAVAGGLADAADHAGALCGALGTGIFLVPLLGFPGALVVLATLKAQSALGWFWQRR